MTGHALPCAYCNHPYDAHHGNLAVDGGLFRPGTRPCTAIVRFTHNPDPAMVSAKRRIGWWPCSCDDFRADHDYDHDYQFDPEGVVGDQPQ